MKELFESIDRPFFFITLILIVVGFLILASASAVLSEKNFQNTYSYIQDQFTRGFLIGVAGFFISVVTPFSFWRKVSVPLMIFSLVLMALIFIPTLGFSHGGATRWLHIGSIIFQPSEILKLSFVIYLASWLESKRHALGDFSAGFIPFVVIMGIVSIFLILQPDIGTLGVILLTAVIMYFVGGGRASQFFTLFIMGLVALFILVQSADYRLARFTVFLNPGHEPQGEGYQINQALIAIGSGGFGGLGIGASREKYSYLPEPIGDSIFAILGEEFGFVGGVGVIALFLAFLWRGLSIAAHAGNLFGKFLAVGLTTSVLVQAFINIGAISGLLPLTGIPLPFMSYGGTSLAIAMTSVGILLNISRG